MKRFTTHTNLSVPLLLLALLLISCTASKETTRELTGSSSEQQEQINEIMNRMPAGDQTESDWLNTQLLQMGSSAVHSLSGMLSAPGSGNDTPARYALNGMAKYLGRNGTEAERTMFERTVLEELEGAHPYPVKMFLMEQLELVGSDRAVPVLTTFVGDHPLNEPAIHALKAINSQSAEQVLLEKLSQTSGERQVSLIQALGVMQVYDVVKPLQTAASNSSDEAIQKVVWYALAQSGNPDAVKILSESGSAVHYLQLATRLAEEGHMQQSAQISREILAGNHPSHIKSSALATLVQVDGAEALDDLTNAVHNSDPGLRSSALKLISKMEGNRVSGNLANELKKADPTVRADIISILGSRGGRPAFSAILPYFEDDHPAVRGAAFSAAVSSGETEALPYLLDALQNAGDQQDIEALKTALLQIPTDPLLEAVAEAIPDAPQQVRIALIDILAERRASGHIDLLLGELDRSDGSVRMRIFNSLSSMSRPGDLPSILALIPEVKTPEELAVLQDAVVRISNEIPESDSRADAVIEAFENASSGEKPDYLPILSGIGGEEALKTTVSALNSDNPDISRAAFQSLTSWPDATALPHLYEAFKSVDYAEEAGIIEGYVRLVANSKYSSENKVQYLKGIIPSLSSPQEKAVILDALAEQRSPQALRAVAEHFSSADSTVQNRAIRAAANILAPSYDRSVDSDGADKVLAVLESTASPEIRKQIEQRILELQSRRQASQGFTSLFNGNDLTGWTGAKDDYRVSDGQIISRAGASGNLFTEEQYSDFIFRFEFKLTPGANNGLAIRSPLEGNPAYDGLELQILDNIADKYTDLEPWQYHGSVYGVAAAKRGQLKPAGEWNSQEVIARGSQITVKLNGKTILDMDLEEASDPETVDGRDHPGLLRNLGHIGFMGHGDEVAFRNIRIRDLNVYYPDYSTGSDNGEGMNRPPEGFKALFNGENLEGWNGLVENPETRAVMSDSELEAAQQKADSVMREHWAVRDGVLYFDGKGESLTTRKTYKDFEMLVDWKIEPEGDSGIYLRGTPQVQIWDITENPVGSGGLYNNQKHASEPLVPADNPIGEWNNMRIKMIGERVTVHLNGELVVPDVVMENYWNREKSIYSSGRIELQSHETPLYFKNIFIREIPRTESLFNGTNLTGWERVGGEAGGWQADNGILYTEGSGEEWEKGTGGGWLSTTETYDNFKLELEYQLPEGGNSGVFLRAPRKGDPAFEGIEIQLLDDYADRYADLESWQYTGSIYDVKAPSKRVSKKSGEWQRLTILADGPKLQVTLNGEMIINTSLIHFMNRVDEHPGLKNREGYIGLQNHNSRVEFRNINITEIK